MDIKELVSIQKQFDKQHGWSLQTNNVTEVLSLIGKDLIGLFGEIGEFANLINKLTRESDRIDDQQVGIQFNRVKNDLNEEFIDTLIYMVRIATHLDIDIEQTYLNKLAINRDRFRRFEVNDKLDSGELPN